MTARAAFAAVVLLIFAECALAQSAVDEARRAVEERLCVSSSAVRIAATAAGAGTALVDLQVAAAEPNWRVELRRDGDAWRVVSVRPPERDLAAALANADPPSQRALLRECDALLTPQLVDELVEQGVRLGSKAKFEREEQLAKLAAEIADETGGGRARARALWLLGRARDSQDAADEALGIYDEARRLAEASGDRATVGRALVGTGWCWISLTEYEKANGPLREGLAIALSAGDHMIADNAYLAISQLHKIRGEYVESLLDLDRARIEAEKAGDGAVVAAALGNAGITFVEMNNGDLARDYLTKAIAMYHRIGSARGEFRNLRNLAEVEASDHHPDRAAAELDRVEAYLKENPNERLSALSAATRGRIARERNDFATADRDVTRALAIFARMGNKDLVADLTNDLSEIRFRQRRYAEAAELAENAVNVALSTGAPTTVYPFAKLNAARAYRKLGNIDAALRACEAAVDSIEGTITSVPGVEQEQSFFLDRSGPYYEMFRLLVARKQPRRALEWVERSRTRTLMQFRGRVTATAEIRGLSAGERDAEAALEQAIVTANRALRELQAAPVKDARRYAEVERQLAQKRVDLEAFEAKLNTAHPEVMLARGALPRPTLSETQKLIPPDGAIVEYLRDTDNSWVVVINRTGRPRIARIDVTAAELRRRVDRFTAHVVSRDLGIDREARRMFDLLLGPVDALLRAKRSLCIIPDGEVWHVPFQALVDRRGRYLIERSAIFYAPSRSLLAWNAKRRTPATAPSGVLVLANPRITAGTAHVASAVRSDESLGPLPDAESEAREIQKIYGRDATVVTGAAATEEFLKQNAGRYRMIHLATHAAFDDTSPLYSHLLLATTPDSHEDGLLEAREILKLDLAADLVVLSSCETGRGEVRSGEGVIGMSWALLVAGCPTAVVSQWKVPSAGTARLMVDFHRRLSRVPPARRRAAAARALRAAQLDLLRGAEYEQPYDWSGFVIVGNGW